MSMYGELLELALRELEESHRGDDDAELATALLEDVDGRAQALGSLGPGADAPGAIAANVSYDAALVHLGRALGVPVDLASFSRPGRARCELEDALAARGVELRAHARASAGP